MNKKRGLGLLHQDQKLQMQQEKIHSDFQSGFIRAETISYDDFVECDGEIKAKELGKMRSEGKEYVVQDGDVMHFLFNN